MVRGSDKLIETINQYVANPKQFRSIQVKNWDWRRDGLGSLVVSGLVLENANSFAVTEVEITCALFDGNGTLIHT